jgi:chromosomal replication initiation ATPase DnaA
MPRVPQNNTNNGADPNCPHCGGQGFYGYNVPIGDPRFGKAFPCDCTAAYRSAQLQAISGLNIDEQHVTLADVIESGPGTSAMVSAARAFVTQPAGIVTFWGGTGNAKTLVLQGVVNECIQRGVMAIYVTMLDLIEYIREAYNDKQDQRYESAWKRMERLAQVPVLCLDEVDKVKASEWTIERETAIFDKRYRLGLARQVGTLLAMNANPDRLPEWIYSRLSDGRNKIIRNADPDMRGLMR